MYIAVVDRNPQMPTMLRDLLVAEGYTVTLWPPRDDAPSYHVASLDLILLDAAQQPASGPHSLLLPHAVHPSPRALVIIVATDITQLNSHADTLHEAGCLILPQPFRTSALLRVLTALNLPSPADEATATGVEWTRPTSTPAFPPSQRKRLPRRLAQWLRLAR